MSWTCLKCKRKFRNTNQSHSCVVLDAETLFFNKSPILWENYLKLLKYFENQQGIKISPVKNAILFSVNTNFLAVKPKPNWLELEFISKLKIDEFPVHKSVQVTKTKYANFVRLEHFNELDKQLKTWLLEAYKLDLN